MFEERDYKVIWETICEIGCQGQHNSQLYSKRQIFACRIAWLTNQNRVFQRAMYSNNNLDTMRI